MTAHRDDRAGAGAVVRKPPMKETAMRCAAGLELSWPQSPAQLGSDGTNIALWGFDVLLYV